MAGTFVVSRERRAGPDRVAGLRVAAARSHRDTLARSGPVVHS